MTYEEAFFDELEKIAGSRLIREIYSSFKKGPKAFQEFARSYGKEHVPLEDAAQYAKEFLAMPRRTAVRGVRSTLKMQPPDILALKAAKKKVKIAGIGIEQTYEEAFFDELAAIQKQAGIGGALLGGGLGTAGGAVGGGLLGGLVGAGAGLITGGPVGMLAGGLGGAGLGALAGAPIGGALGAVGGGIGGRRVARAGTTLAGGVAGSLLGPVGSVGGAYLGSRMFAPKKKPMPQLQAGPSVGQMSGAGLPGRY